MRVPTALAASIAILLAATTSRAVLFASTGQPDFNTAPPGGALAGSGWDLQGDWGSLSGTPIGPQHFISAAHAGGEPGDTFWFRGVAYVTDAVERFPGEADLAIWHVTTRFPDWATLYRGDGEVGREVVVFGRGTQRGGEIVVDRARGWDWGPGDGVRRWGTNTVDEVVPDLPYEGVLLAATFDRGASENEAHLSSGDSGGGVFLRDDDGRWKLAGVADGVDGYYVAGQADLRLLFGNGLAALYDASELWLSYDPGALPAAQVSGPSRWYATRLSAYQAWIDAVVPAPVPEPAAGAAGAAAAGGLLGLRAAKPARHRDRSPPA